MTNKIMMSRISRTALAAAGFILFLGFFGDANAQTRDPFAKPAWARTNEKGSRTGANSKPAEPENLEAPPIEQRIAHYKLMREFAAANDQPIPKVTSVLTLGEMNVTGVFKTARGYAAIVEATPIKLSYTVYPGEKFYDGQLVAVDEDRLVFRKVTKMSNGKFVASVENKSLRKYTDREQIQGTAPMQNNAANARAAEKPVITPIVSLVDEMNRSALNESEDAKAPAKSKKPVRTARNR